MAETEAVLAPTEGQSDESPTNDIPVLGMGINEVDTDSGSDPEVGSGQTTADSRTTEGNRPSVESTSSDEDADGSMMRKDYTRKTMELADDRRALESERAELRKQQDEWFKTRETNVTGSQPQPAVVPGANSEMSAQQLAAAVQYTQQAMASPNLSADQRLQIQQELIALQGLQGMRGEIDELRSFREEMAPLLQQTANSVTQLTQAQKDAHVQKRLDKVKEAQDLFGEDTVKQYGSQVYMHFNAEDNGNPMTNPATNEPYTPAEIVAMYSGVSLQEAQQARNRNGRARTQAKQGTRPAGAQQQAPVAAGGALQSRAEAEAEILATLS